LRAPAGDPTSSKNLALTSRNGSVSAVKS
jgi:hypothetical protein